MNSVLIKNALIVNEGTTIESDLRIEGKRISHIASEIKANEKDQIIDAKGMYLLPGMIDDQVHFREPGLTHKGNIASESIAAVAGGITSYMEMPNVNPSTTTLSALEAKFEIAHNSSMANYSFYLGATEDNLEQIEQLDPRRHCGVKVFMGASTGDLLVENPAALDAIFRNSPTLIVTHCENGNVIKKNLEEYEKLGKIPKIEDHPIIRDVEACYASSSYAVNLAKKYNSQLHVLHITTEKELELFNAGPIEKKSITAEACVHHLWFTADDYFQKGNFIKCNPSIKSSNNRDALIKALNSDIIDIVATDHAPHTREEKEVPYSTAPAGLPLVQHALLSMLDHVKHHRLTIEKVVEKVCHNPAIRYKIQDRGYIREGHFADLVLVDTNATISVSHENSLYKCGWTPFSGHTFSSSIQSTWINGQQVYNGQRVLINETALPSQALIFN